MSDPQTLIDTLARLCANDRSARERGDAKSVAQYKVKIDATLKALNDLGYDSIECLSWVEAE